MKRSFVAMLLVVLFTFPLFAAGNSKVLTLNQSVQVGSVQLPAGNCKVTWTGTGSDVQLTLTSKGNKSVTVPAQMTEEKFRQTGVSVREVNGVKVLDEFQFDNLRFAIHPPQVAAK
jgi:hypothetical protein